MVPSSNLILTTRLLFTSWSLNITLIKPCLKKSTILKLNQFYLNNIFYLNKRKRNQRYGNCQKSNKFKPKPYFCLFGNVATSVWPRKFFCHEHRKYFFQIPSNFWSPVQTSLVVQYANKKHFVNFNKTT